MYIHVHAHSYKYDNSIRRLREYKTNLSAQELSVGRDSEK